MNLHIILDFDGVLFDSAPEVYKICEKITKGNKNYKQKCIDFLHRQNAPPRENIIGFVSSPVLDLNVSTNPIDTAPTGVLKFP